MQEEVGALTERDLVVKFRRAYDRKAELKAELAIVQEQLDNTETKLLERLADQGKNRSAKYEGIGFITSCKPRLYASCSEENKDNLFKFLKESSREDLIKETVAAGSLSSFIGELVAEGQKIPEFITVALMPWAKLTKD